MVLQKERKKKAIQSFVPVEASSFGVNRYQGKNDKSGITCDNCKMTGHTVETCYRIIGFPPDFKFTKPKPNVFKQHQRGQRTSGFKPKHMAQVATSEGVDGRGMEGVQFSQEQLEKLMALLNNDQPQNPSKQTHRSNMDLSTKRMIGLVSLHQGLYYLKTSYHQVATSSQTFPQVCQAVDQDLWHHRLGHLSNQRLQFS